MNPLSKEILVGLCGRAGSGKDTVAGLLAQHYHFGTYSMADPIRAGLAAMLDLNPDTLTDRVCKEQTLPWLGKSPRYLMQTLGTDWGRWMVCDDIWIKLMRRKWESVRHSHTPRLVVPDIRFDDEAKAILDQGGTVWRVEREDLPPVEDHVSEAGITRQLITGIIKNNDSLSQLETRIISLGQVLQQKFSK